MVTMILLELLRHLLHSFGLEGMCNHLHSSPDTRDYRITLVLNPVLEKTAYLKVNNLWDHSTTNENQRVISTTKDNWGHCGNNYISIKKITETFHNYQVSLLLCVLPGTKCMELPLSPTFNNDKSDCLQLKLTLITLFPIKKNINSYFLLSLIHFSKILSWKCNATVHQYLNKLISENLSSNAPNTLSN